MAGDKDKARDSFQQALAIRSREDCGADKYSKRRVSFFPEH